MCLGQAWAQAHILGQDWAQTDCERNGTITTSQRFKLFAYHCVSLAPQNKTQATISDEIFATF